MHSVAMLPCQMNLKQKQKILKEFSKYNLDVVVMSKTSKKYLIEKIKFNENKVHLIYHGAPKFEKVDDIDKAKIRKNLGFEKSDKIIYTYGFLREDKGIKEIINSLPHILQKEQ